VIEEPDRLSLFLVFASRRYHRDIGVELAKFGLSLSDYSSLLFLFHNEEREGLEEITQALIADYVAQDRGLVSKSVRKLETLGYVSICRGKRNSSHHSLSITDEGRVIASKIDAIILDWEKRCLEALDPEDRETFLRSISTLISFIWSGKMSGERSS